MHRCTAALAALFLLGCGSDSPTSDDPADAAAADAPIDAIRIDAPPPVDARPAALACLGAALPTEAPTTITVNGTATELTIGGGNPVAGATIELFVAGSGSPAATDETDSNGRFAIDITTGGTPVDGYLRATADSRLVTHVVAPTPISADVPAVPVTLFSRETFGFVSGIAGVTPDPTRGTVVVAIVDCDNQPVEGAVLSVSPGDGVEYVYLGAAGLPTGNETATSAEGLAIAFNVPPGEVQVNAQVSGMSLRGHATHVVADTITTTGLVP